MRRLLATTTIGALLMLGACGPSGDSTDETQYADPAPIDPETAAAGDQRSGGKADRLAKCAPDAFGYEPGGTASVAGELGGDCQSRHYIPVFDIDRPVQFDMRGTSELVRPDGTSNSSLVGICLLRWQYDRIFGGSDQPSEFVRDGWSRDQLAYEGETPCGHFRPTGDGGFEPVEGTKGFAGLTLKPGRYRLMIQAPENLDQKATFAYDLAFDIEDLGGPVCGDGRVEEHQLWTEQCDEGDRNPFDACSSGCRWQRAMVVDGEGVSEPNDEARTAFDLEGFHRVDWRGRVAPEGDDPEDWFRLRVGDGDTLSFGEYPHRSGGALGESILLSFYRAGDDFSQPVATDFGSRTFEDLEAGEYLLRVRPSDSVDSSERPDYYFRISPGPR